MITSTVLGAAVDAEVTATRTPITTTVKPPTTTISPILATTALRTVAVAQPVQTALPAPTVPVMPVLTTNTTPQTATAPAPMAPKPAAVLPAQTTPTPVITPIIGPASMGPSEAPRAAGNSPDNADSGDSGWATKVTASGQVQVAPTNDLMPLVFEEKRYLGMTKKQLGIAGAALGVLAVGGIVIARRRR